MLFVYDTFVATVDFATDSTAFSEFEVENVRFTETKAELYARASQSPFRFTRTRLGDNRRATVRWIAEIVSPEITSTSSNLLADKSERELIPFETTITIDGVVVRARPAAETGSAVRLTKHDDDGGRMGRAE